MPTEDKALDQWVVLRLDGHEYALPVERVMEVLRMAAIRPLPEAPPWIAGVLNVRGQGIVVMHLRQRLGLPAREPDLHSQIVIVDSRNEKLGVIVDRVIDTITLPRSALMPAEKLTGALPLFAFLVHAGERSILVLDLDRLAPGPLEHSQ
jgi:purine-binding chemotaxis protein CheW